MDNNERRAEFAKAILDFKSSQDAVDEVLGKKTEIDALLEKLRKAALKEGAENYVRTFKTLEAASKRRLRLVRVVVALSIATIVFAYRTFNAADFVGSHGEIAPVTPSCCTSRVAS